ncbi:hypothetical protein [Agromyces neolithicus]|uniref:7-cyano-7-deazaguanine synthase n=1 Tax=Agromyces neolithicus TaxID=269420 RepID=A0ABP4XZL0_9MICO
MLNSNDGQITWSVPVGGLTGAPDHLWFRLPEEHAPLVTDRADPAVIGLLIPAMHAAEPMHVSGPVTDELAHNLTHGYQHILETVIRGLRRVNVDATNTTPGGEPARGVGTGFSAGVDSYAVLAEHFFQPVPQDLRVTHLTFFNVGSHTSGERGRSVFRSHRDRLVPVAQEIGLPFIPVDSNLDDFYGFTNFQQTNGPRNLSAASLLQAGLGRYYLAGSVSFPNITVRRLHDTAFSEPISMPLLATRQFRPISHGDQYTRVEKTLMVADIPVARTSLNVCTNPLPDGGNCSHCPKCARTELTLEISNRLEEFRVVFDIAAYRKSRTSFMDWVVTQRSSVLAGEIREQARRAGFRLPPAPVALTRRGVTTGRRKALSLLRRARRRLSR